MQKVFPLIRGDRAGEAIRVLGRGLIFRPARSHIRVVAYRAEYDELLTHLNALLA
jgi:hypothetical protein